MKAIDEAEWGITPAQAHPFTLLAFLSHADYLAPFEYYLECRGSETRSST